MPCSSHGKSADLTYFVTIVINRLRSEFTTTSQDRGLYKYIAIFKYIYLAVTATIMEFLIKDIIIFIAVNLQA